MYNYTKNSKFSLSSCLYYIGTLNNNKVLGELAKKKIRSNN